jgi:hypothetical protein
MRLPCLFATLFRFVVLLPFALPDARLSVFDITHALNPFLIAEIPVGVEPVSVNARDNDEVWVVNEVSDSVSVVSVSRRIVTDTLYVKDEPADVVGVCRRQSVRQRGAEESNRRVRCRHACVADQHRRVW